MVRARIIRYLDLDPNRSTPAFMWLYSRPSLFLKKPPVNAKPTIEDLQVMVFDRIAAHAHNSKIERALLDLNGFIRKLCSRSYRYDLLELLATIPLPDTLELHYLLDNKIFFRHYKKFELVYKSLKIKNIKNRANSIIDPNKGTQLLYESEMRVHIQYANMKTSTSNSTSSNFLLDFGFVESVGSGLLLLKVY